MTHDWCVRFVSYTKPAVHEWNGNGSDTLTSSMALTPAWKATFIHMDKLIPYFIRSRKFITVFIKSHQSSSISHYETDSPHIASLSLSLSLSFSRDPDRVSVQVETFSGGTAQRGSPGRKHPSNPRYYSIWLARVVKEPNRFVFDNLNAFWQGVLFERFRRPKLYLHFLLPHHRPAKWCTPERKHINYVSVLCLLHASDFGKSIIRQLTLRLPD